MRKCVKCGAEKKEVEFYSIKYGRCIECVKNAVRSYRDKNIERIREYDRNRPLRPRDPKKKKAAKDRYYLKHKEEIQARNMEYYHAHKKEISEHNKIKRKENGILEKERDLKDSYGINLSTYNGMLEKQDGACAICKKHKSEFRRDLCVDHCHKSKKIRGLLCTNCNLGLGYFKESTDNLRRAVEYLDNDCT